MKQNVDWTVTSTSNDPLTLYRMIEKTILAQTEDQYPFATVYDQEMGLNSFLQETMSNAQCYKRFNTKVDVSNAIGVTRQHQVLLEYVAQEVYIDAFDNLHDANKAIVRDDAEERYISYVFLRKSGKQYTNLKTALQNDFTTGYNKYPKLRQSNLHLLEKYTKTAVHRPTESEGAAFAQKGGKGKGGKHNYNDGDYDKEYWKDKRCYNCDKLGHPASHCKSKKTDDDD